MNISLKSILKKILQTILGLTWRVFLFADAVPLAFKLFPLPEGTLLIVDLRIILLGYFAVYLAVLWILDYACTKALSRRLKTSSDLRLRKRFNIIYWVALILSCLITIGIAVLSYKGSDIGILTR